MRMHWTNLRYILRHKWFVFLECCKLGIPWLGIVHDWSKFRLSEWMPYALSFYGGWEYNKRPQWMKDAFDVAWNYHQKRNKHHWQYWLLTNDSDEPQTIALPMPDCYCREMLADWRGAGKAITGKDNTPIWYKEHKSKMHLHSETREWIEQQLALPLGA